LWRAARREAHGIDGPIAPGGAKHPTAANGKVDGPLTQRMRKKIDDGGFETPYRLRTQAVELVFGQIKQPSAVEVGALSRQTQTPSKEPANANNGGAARGKRRK
jgi:hypothetical protein